MNDEHLEETGMNAWNIILYWSVGLTYLMVETCTWPKWLQRYKIQPTAVIDKKRLYSVFLFVLLVETHWFYNKPCFARDRIAVDYGQSVQSVFRCRSVLNLGLLRTEISRDFTINSRIANISAIDHHICHSHSDSRSSSLLHTSVMTSTNHQSPSHIHMFSSNFSQDVPSPTALQMDP